MSRIKYIKINNRNFRHDIVPTTFAQNGNYITQKIITYVFFALILGLTNVSTHHVIAQSLGKVIESGLIHDRVGLGAQNAHEILIERARQAHISCTGGGGDLVIKLIDPSGNVIDSETEISEYDIYYEFFDFLEGGVEGSYILEGNYPTGNWKVQLSTSDTSLLDIYYTIGVYFIDTELKMGSFVDKESPKTDETITINTSLRRNNLPVLDASVLAIISLVWDVIDSLRLYDDGLHNDSLANDGIYSSQFKILKQGDYHARIEANKTGDEPFARSDEYDVSFIVNNSTIDELVGERVIDSDGDGLYDKLVLNISLNITLPHRYFLRAHLYDKNNRKIIHNAKAHAVFSPGYQTLELPFDGVAILENGVDGPYFVKTLVLTDSLDYIPALDSVEDFHTTEEYNFSDFKRGPIYFGKHTTNEMDIDSDGLYDSLIVDFEVKLEHDGFYKWYSHLRCAKDNRIIANVNFDGNYKSGISNIRFSFGGSLIKRKHCDGPYAVYASGIVPRLAIKSKTLLMNEPIFRTKEYKYTDFE
jgi:hypothetical protein